MPVDRHEVDDLADTVGGEEPGDQNSRVGEIELPHGGARGVAGEGEEAAAVVVEQPPNRLGASKRGAQNQSTTPSDDTSAAVRMFPTRPCSAIGG